MYYIICVIATKDKENISINRSFQTNKKTIDGIMHDADRQIEDIIRWYRLDCIISSEIKIPIKVKNSLPAIQINS